MSDGLRSGRVDLLRSDAQGNIWVFATDSDDDITTTDVLDPATGILRPVEALFPELRLKQGAIVRVGPQREHGVLVFGAASPARCIIRDGKGALRIIPLEGERFLPLGDDRNGAIIGHLVGAD
ncbi:MAG TPA: hypothetical protein PK760_08205, partial [Flavobacteriales bacterium]|nr:hypothetical protein [Flavobacteriales bacterium]